MKNSEILKISLIKYLESSELLDNLIYTERPKPYLVKSQPSDRLLSNLKSEKGLYGEQLEASTTTSSSVIKLYSEDKRPSILYNLASNHNINEEIVLNLSKKAISHKNSNIAIALIKWNANKIPKEDFKLLYALISFRNGKEGINAIAEGLVVSNYETAVSMIENLPKLLYNSKASTKEQLFGKIKEAIHSSGEELSIEMLGALFVMYKKLPINDYYSASLNFISLVKSLSRTNTDLGPFHKFLIEKRKAYESSLQTEEGARFHKNYSEYKVEGLTSEYDKYHLSELVQWEHSCHPIAVSELAMLLGLQDNVLTSHENWAAPFKEVSNYTEERILRLVHGFNVEDFKENRTSYARKGPIISAYCELFAHSAQIRKIIARQLLQLPDGLYFQPLSYGDYVAEVKNQLMENTIKLKSAQTDTLYNLVYFLYNINDSLELKNRYLEILLQKVENDQLAADILRTLSSSELKGVLASESKELQKQVQKLQNITLPANPLLRKQELESLASANFDLMPLDKWTGYALNGIVNYISKHCTNTSKLDTLIQSVDGWAGDFKDLVEYANKV